MFEVFKNFNEKIESKGVLSCNCSYLENAKGYFFKFTNPKECLRLECKYKKVFTFTFELLCLFGIFII